MHFLPRQRWLIILAVLVFCSCQALPDGPTTNTIAWRDTPESAEDQADDDTRSDATSELLQLNDANPLSAEPPAIGSGVAQAMRPLQVPATAKSNDSADAEPSDPESTTRKAMSAERSGVFIRLSDFDEPNESAKIEAAAYENSRSIVSQQPTRTTAAQQAAIEDCYAPPALPCQPSSAMLAAHPFEYLCDGGDQGIAANLSPQGELRGIELEDTIAVYSDRQGQQQIRPSSRVCIYAPRFAAVRRVTRVEVGDEYITAATAAVPTQLQATGRQVPPLDVDRRDAVQRRVHTDVATPFVERQRGAELVYQHPLSEFAYTFQVHEDFQVIRIGIYNQTDRLAMTEFLDAVTTWTINQAAQITVENLAAHETKLSREAGTIYSFDEPEGPELRLIKLASTGSAEPGETVEFTLRFDNVGHSEARDVVLVDNLTTRLEYVPNSAQSSVDADFSTTSNDGESLRLEWKLTNPIAPGQGGVLRFKCRVR